MESTNSREENTAYAIILLLGLACVLPWTAATTAADYFNLVYDGMGIEFWFPVCNFPPLLLGLAMMALFGQKWNMKLRLQIAMLTVIFSMTTFLLTNFLVNRNQINQMHGFCGVLISLGASSAAISVLQASLYGICGMMGERYIQSLQFGMGWCEIFISAVRFLTKSNCSVKFSGVVFFAVTDVTLVSAYGLLFRLLQLKLVKVAISSHSSSTALSKMAIPEPETPSYGTLRGPKGNSHEDLEKMESSRSCVSPSALLLSTAAGPARFWSILRKAWEPYFVIFWTFATCLSFFPGVITSFRSRYWSLSSWFPVILVTVYCLGDIVGKGLPAYANIFNTQNKPALWTALLAHFCFFPLFIAGIQCPESFLFGSEIYYCSIILLLGFSTGYLGVACSMLVTNLVDQNEVERAGMLCPFFIISGLLGGSFIGVYCFSDMLETSSQQ